MRHLNRHFMTTCSVFLLMTGCTEEIPSHTVVLKVSDSLGAPVSEGEPIENIEVTAYAQTTSQQPKDGVTEASTDANGKVNLTLGEFDHYVNMFPQDYMGANVYFTVGANDIDYSEHPIILPERYNHCSNILGITDDDESWLRIYKTADSFSADDTLTITPSDHTNTVNSGEDIAEEPVVAASGQLSNVYHIDIYLGTLPSADTLGHKHTSFQYNAGDDEGRKYMVTLNDVSIEVSSSNCGHAYTAVYF